MDETTREGGVELEEAGRQVRPGAVAPAAEGAGRGPEPAGGSRPGPAMRPFFILWGGQALSLVGSQAVQFALVWYLTLETGSPAILATATLFALLPQVILGPFVGALVDRWNRRWTMFAADAAVALASLALALLFLAGRAGVGTVLVFLLLRAVGGAFHRPAMIASTSLMVPREHLSRIQGLNQMLQGGLNIAAAPLGAFLVALLSMPGILAVDVLTALFAIVPLLFIRVPQPSRDGAAEAGGGARLPAEIMAGFRYLLGRRGHMALIGMAALVNLCLVPAFSLLPLLVREELGGGAAELGWLTSIFGVGTLAGGILLGVWGGFRRRIVTTLAALVGLGGATVGIGLVPPSAAAAAFVALFLVGVMAPLANGPIQAVMQATIAPEFQGRVFTLMGSLAGITAPLGLLLAAPVAEILGVRFWYFLGGIICASMGVGSFLISSIVRIEDGADPSQAPVAAGQAGEAEPAA